MAGMAPYVPTPKADRFKPGDTVQWREESLMGHGYRLGQLWGRAENPTRTKGYGYWAEEVAYQGKFWFVVTEDRTAYRVSERDMTHVMSREEQRVLI